MLETCSRPPRAQSAVLLLTVSACVWAAWAAVSSPRALAGARHSSVFTVGKTFAHTPASAGLQRWIDQHQWNPNVIEPYGGASNSSYTAVVTQVELRDSSTQLPRAVALAHAPTRSASAASTTETTAPGAAAPANAPAPPTPSSLAQTHAPATHPFADAPGQLPAAQVSAPRLEAPAYTPVPGTVTAPGPADSAEVPAARPVPSIADPRWLTGAAHDLRACLQDERDGLPATIEDVIAGELPR